MGNYLQEFRTLKNQNVVWVYFFKAWSPSQWISIAHMVNLYNLGFAGKPPTWLGMWKFIVVLVDQSLDVIIHPQPQHRDGIMDQNKCYVYLFDLHFKLLGMKWKQGLMKTRNKFMTIFFRSESILCLLFEHILLYSATHLPRRSFRAFDAPLRSKRFSKATASFMAPR